MNKLDDLKLINQLDQGGVIPAIEALPFQIKQVIEDSILIKIPREYSRVNKVVVNGMGGSNIGARILKTVFSSEIKVPLLVEPGYKVPAYVDKNTLYIISSYSGSTEEPLSCYQEAKKRGAKILAITSQSGNRLEKLMLKDNIPGYIFKPENNKSNIPRYALGYSVFGILVLLAKTGLLNINVSKVEKIITNLEVWDYELRPQIKAKQNPAKIIAAKIFNKIAILVGAEFLEGNIKALRNQFCESGKNFAIYLMLPELNHYAMEGLACPKGNKKNLSFLFFDSKLYSPRIQRRSELTKQVVKKSKISYTSYQLKGESKLEQAMEMLQLGSWLTFYLAALNDINPAGNPFVDWFKKELK